MVRIIICSVLSVFVSSIVISQERVITPDELKKRLKKGELERKTAGERLKALGADTSSLRILQEKELIYKLPNNELVRGMLLPNGKKAPAIKTRFGLNPACVTKDYTLVVGFWNADKNGIECRVSSEELAYVFDGNNSAIQIGSDGKTVKKKANKYSNTVAVKESLTDRNKTKDESVDKPKSDSQEKLKSANKYNTVSNDNRITTKTDIKHKSGKNNNTNTISINKEDVYIPPPRNSSTVSTVAGTLDFDEDRYGITMGTWAKAELKRQASSAESGEIEFTLLESVYGKYQTLPAGTIIFAKKSFNEGSRRLEALTSSAITPDGNEIQSIQAYVYTLDQTAGLPGAIVRNREGEVVSAGANTLLTTASRVIPGGDSLALSAASEFSSELLGNEKRHAPQKPSAVINVAPQRVLLKFAKSF